jgi:hypothetical protein
MAFEKGSAVDEAMRGAEGAVGKFARTMMGESVIDRATREAVELSAPISKAEHGRSIADVARRAAGGGRYRFGGPSGSWRSKRGDDRRNRKSARHH